MLYSTAISYGLLFAIGINAQSQTDSASASASASTALLDSISSGSQQTSSGSASQSTTTTPPSTSDGNLVLSGTAKHTTTTLTGTRNETTTRTNSTSTQTTTSITETPTNITPCNGNPLFCDRKYGNITEVAAHNSPFIRPGNAAANQALPVTAQLDDGIRLLQGQIHFLNSTPHFCHSSCDILDAGPITDYLGTVYKWITTHPYDVVTILLGNGDYKPVEDFVPFLEATGLVQFAYIPPKAPMNITDWPTLGSMILSGKRVIFFMDYEANQKSVPWILDEFSQVWETPFDPIDRTFPCVVQRPPNLPDPETKKRLALINHNLNYEISILGNSILVPNIPLLNITNNVTGFGSLGENAKQCTEKWSQPPKFLNVDYYNAGSGTVFEVAAKCNNVTYNPEQPCCGSAKSGTSRAVEINGVLVTGVVAMLAALYLS